MLPMLRNSNLSMAPVASGPINRLGSFFDDFFGDDGAFAGQVWSGAPVAMWEDDDQIHIEIELAGMSEQDIEVTVHNDKLFIRAERKVAEGRRYLVNSRSFGQFEQMITLPEAIDTERANATLTNGVLGIDLPKSPEAKPRKITLKTE